MSEIKLKPCPFCGGTPNCYIKVLRGMSQDYIKIAVTCNKCDIEKEYRVASGSPFELIIKAYIEANKEWNRRANENE